MTETGTVAALPKTALHGEFGHPFGFNQRRSQAIKFARHSLLASS